MTSHASAAYRNGGRQGRTQKCERFGDQTRQLHGLAFLLALAAEGENLLHQVFGPAPRDADLLQVIPYWGGRRNTTQRQLCIAEDGAQDIVEVMGNPPGEGTDGLQLLDLSQLRFQVQALGEVTCHDDIPGYLGVLVQRGVGQLYENLLALFMLDRHLHVG